jgi:hypothetical protein
MDQLEEPSLVESVAAAIEDNISAKLPEATTVLMHADALGEFLTLLLWTMH